ncbi:hypothetical protein C4573_02070 [Candidatus Woesearchaeota archaeon]|nr:MAG: hypothetical protein C4573_02070 [Candidatus Woesearchaeota archaeon]
MGRGKYAQVSVEYILIVGFAFLLTIPLLLIFNTQSRDMNQGISDAQIIRVADEINAAINAVYYLGPPSTKTVTLYFPQGINAVMSTNTSFWFVMESAFGDYDVPRWPSAPIDVSLKTYEGIHVITITANEFNVSVHD